MFVSIPKIQLAVTSPLKPCVESHPKLGNYILDYPCELEYIVAPSITLDAVYGMGATFPLISEHKDGQQ